MTRLSRRLITQAGQEAYVVEHDVTPVLDLCQGMRQENREFDLPDGSGRLVASIDRAMFDKVQAETGRNLLDGSKESADYLFKMLNGDWAKFKITSGHLATSSGHH